MSKPFEQGAIILGSQGEVAAWRRPTQPPSVARFPPSVIIFSSATTDEGAHTPASSINVCGVDALIALRSAIDEALKPAGS